MKAVHKVELGQEVYVLSPQWQVIRTMVAKIDNQGQYEFLNGDSYRLPHWFLLDDAIVTAHLMLDHRKAALRESLRALNAKSRALNTNKYRQSVVDAPYRVADVRDRDGSFSRKAQTRYKKKVTVPENYLKPGTLVYVVVTPRTTPREYGYRPHSCFVLETEIASVCIAPNGEPHHTYAIPFDVEEHFPTREAATKRLASYSEPGTVDPTPFVSRKEWKKGYDKWDKENPPF